MVRTASVVSAALLGAFVASSASAQTPAAPPARRLADLRHQIFVMEGALARAVLFGAQQVSRQLRSVSPELMTLAGDAQARGVYLDGYGVFFDVGVPILRQSMMWSLRELMMRSDDNSLRVAIGALEKQQASERDPVRRSELADAIARLRLQLTPEPFVQPGRGTLAQPAGVGAAVMPPDAAPALAAPSAPAAPQASLTPQAPPAVERAVLQDPNRAYTDSVKNALVDAMIDYAAPMLIAPDEWLTVGARDNEPRDTFAPQDPSEEVVTILLRIRGEDLAAYRAGRIDRDEAKRRVQVREF